MSITIREGLATDAGRLAGLARLTFAQAFAAYNTPQDMAAYMDAAFTQAQTARELADAASLWLLAEAGHELAGFAKLRRAAPPAPLATGRVLELQRLYVEQAWIGRGVGAQLMQRCLDTARRQGHDRVWLGVWEHNPRAIAFYRKWGFEVFGSHIFQLGNDPQTDLLMARPV